MVLDQLYIIEKAGERISCKYEWGREGRNYVRERLEEIPAHDIDRGFAFLGDSSAFADLMVSDIEIIKKDNPVFAEFFLSRKVKEVIAAPFHYHGHIQGYLVGENPHKEDILKKEFLETASFFFGSELRAERYLSELQYRNNHDLLTNVKNRNAMEKEVQRLQRAAVPLAVVYADLNGLKQINDEIGHAAGNAILQKAARILVAAFDESCVYRAGGDEFVVLKEKISQEELLQKIAQINKQSAVQNAAMSIGYCYAPDSSSIEQTMKQADEAMYENKKLYYQTHGKNNRRKSEYSPNCAAK